MDVRLRLCLSRRIHNLLSPSILKRFSSSEVSAVDDVITRRNKIFSLEKTRQFEEIGRIEKIEVEVSSPSESTVLVMNKDISTPLDCTKHISEAVTKSAALALVDSSEYWDMNRPLTKSCNLKFLTFKDPDPRVLNRVFWRSCSVILGAVVANAFKDHVNATLHSFPAPSVKSGSFVYDVQLGLDDWQPTEDELRILSAEMVMFIRNNYPFERLNVSEELALEIFEGNEFKMAQVPSIAATDRRGEVTLYRVGQHIDMSRGPCIADTSFVGRCTVTAVHKLESEIKNLYRFQGVALPKGIMLNHFAYGIIEDRAKKLNPGLLPDSEEYRMHNNEKLQEIQNRDSDESAKLTA